MPVDMSYSEPTAVRKRQTLRAKIALIDDVSQLDELNGIIDDILATADL